MGTNLLIVESPAKARTIKKYLGPGFEVMASYGHVRDLVPKEGAVDPDHDFRMKYQVIEKSDKHVQAIVKALKKSDALYLATDPDREGEAISWHLKELLESKGALSHKPVHRVVFYEITERAVQDAVDHPRGLSMDLVNAQQARRALDYLVGFNLSPLLWRKVRRGLSAGRVQSPALRMIVEREEEIERFEPREYWTIEADAQKADQAFVARLTRLAGEKVEQFTITHGEQAAEVERVLTRAAEGRLAVLEVEKKQRKRNPAPPFTTSTLQQEAARKLGFSASRTMRVAQQLYEGVDIGGGSVGLITYMRTDSVSLAQEAVGDLRRLIEQRYGAQKLPAQPRHYHTRTKNAQEAHEAIRPTAPEHTPDSLKDHLSQDQLRLYDLIWKRAVACQMVHATIATVGVDLGAGPGNVFRATGSTIVDPGFMAVYLEGVDDAKVEEQDKALPPMTKGESVELRKIRPEQHFTEPPPRYSEASLVRALEEYGIGRPSTYAAIISTLQQREYVTLENKRFVPTDVGRIVSRFLTDHFTQYVDYDFTAKLEDQLDAVSRGEAAWVPLMQRFWKRFHELVGEKDASLTRSEVAQARELGHDPKSGRVVSVRMGRYGPFVQIGTRDDEEKPRFAGLRPDQRMDAITLADALELFKLPRQLGETPEGEPMVVGIGRFGPYVRFGNKFVSLKKDDDPLTIDRDRALELVAEKKAAEANRVIRAFEGSEVQVLRGRFGPYITNGGKNARVPKDLEPESLDLATCERLLAEAPERRGRGASKKKAAARPSAKKAAPKKRPAAKKKASAKKGAAPKGAAAKKAGSRAAAKARTKTGTRARAKTRTKAKAEVG
jgi:DNA topoisomerase-1